MKKIFVFLFWVSLHSLAIGVIILAFMPLAKWYFENPVLPKSVVHVESQPLWGVDFYYTATLTNFLKNNFSLPPSAWNYIWFTGWPFLSNFPILHFYLILPLLKFFHIIAAVKIYMLASLGIFFVGLYACFYRVSKNFAISIILAIAGIYSVGVYGTLMWGGSLPNHATQAFFPWVVFFIISFLQSKNVKDLLAGSLLAGLAIWGHPQIVIAYIYPTVAILMLFAFGGVRFSKRIKHLILFIVLSLAIGAPQVVSSAGETLKSFVVTDAFKVATSTARFDSQLAADIAAFHRRQPERIYVDTNKTIFVFLAISFIFFLASFIYRRKTTMIAYVLPFTIISGYFIFYISLLAFGISIYHGGWYRLFWGVPLWLGLLASSLWGGAESSLQEKLGRHWLYLGTTLSMILVLIGIPLLIYFSQDTQEKIIPRSNPSSAFPDVLNLRDTHGGFEKLKTEMVPGWFDSDNTNYRIYDGDQTVNIWWNSLYKMPLARGYLDPASAKSKGYLFWLDAALSSGEKGEDQLVESFGYPKEIAFNNTLFLIDWYGVKFLEGGHGGPTTLAVFPKSLTTEEYIKNKERLDFNSEVHSSGGKSLIYYELKDEFVSPILESTNSPTVGIFATDSGYETVVRAIADANLGPKKLIPVKLGNFLDRVALDDLVSFDTLILYDYKYRNKGNAFNKIFKYVEKGHKVFIDTGIEDPESQAVDLPEIFPIENSVRKSLGSSWDFEIAESDLTHGVSFSAFSPPLFDQSEWKFSYPPNISDLRSDSKAVLKNQGVPLLVTRDNIIWSGLNLPYHVIRFHNAEEVKFFVNIINYLIPTVRQLSGLPAQAGSAVYHSNFINSQKRVIKTRGAKGILFKEQNYPGWSASVGKIWSAGPAYPGFMYVRIPDNLINKEVVIAFNYRGSISSWFFFLISLAIVVFILELLLLRGKTLGRLLKHLVSTSHKKVRSWWGREDE